METDRGPALVNHENSANFRESRESEFWERDRQLNLNCCLLIPKALIRVSRVDGGIRSLAAAPDGPETRPLVSASAASMIFCSLRGSTFKATDASTRAICGEASVESTTARLCC